MKFETYVRRSNALLKEYVDSVEVECIKCTMDDLKNSLDFKYQEVYKTTHSLMNDIEAGNVADTLKNRRTLLGLRVVGSLPLNLMDKME